MKGWRDTGKDSGEVKIFRHRYFSLEAACESSTGPDVSRMVNGGTEEGEMGGGGELIPSSVRYQEIKSLLRQSCQCWRQNRAWPVI